MSEKVEKNLYSISEENMTPQESERLITELYVRANRPIERYLRSGDDDFSFSLPGIARFRVNTYHQRGSMAAVVRVVVFEIPNWKDLHIPEQIMEIADDSENYLTALRACLRQAPDVILLGEMRDHETIRTAMTAAETGHLLIATLHTKGAVNTIDRIVDSFPGEQQLQIRVQLSMVLETVISQQLLPGMDGELVPAYEIMHMNNAIRSLIRENKSHQIDNAIASGSGEGMISMDQSILTLYREGKITKETALDYADHPEQLLRRM